MPKIFNVELLKTKFNVSAEEVDEMHLKLVRGEQEKKEHADIYSI